MTSEMKALRLELEVGKRHVRHLAVCTGEAVDGPTLKVVPCDECLEAQRWASE